MNKEIKKVPTVRFKGFIDDWEPRKLGDILVERNIQHPQSKEYPLVSFTVEEGVTPKTERYEREQLVVGDKLSKKYKETRFNDIVYNPANLKFGAIARNKYGNAVFSPIYVTFDVKKQFANPIFIEMLVIRKSFIQRALQYQQGTVYERMAVQVEDFLSLNVMVPSIQEQQKIGEISNNITTIITLHQRKLDQLQTLKNYCLQNMFPAKGEKAPAIRLKGFMDDWKQHKLGELLTFRNGFNGNSQQYGSGIPLISVMDILNNNFIFSDLIRSKAALNETEIKRYAVHYGDVLFQRSSETAEDAGTSNVYLDSQNIAVFGGFVICGRKIGDYDPVFLKYLLDSNKIRRQIVIRAQGAQHVNVSQDTLKDISIDLPSMSEQKMIGAHLYNLDNLITLQQRKLDQLQSLKKFMLQNLFI
ncbi:restriction endonuclease subunit S [uncultured Megasphaera sp.]|uniref:restriction endonuclease subunit S n=1 Tax=uncultured Megasphaera sp. TaxID=165188 RepID=UPI0026237E4C|nr:restriction endonuclease subunit S [uncultured Megasphaera sp.]